MKPRTEPRWQDVVWREIAGRPWDAVLDELHRLVGHTEFGQPHLLGSSEGRAGPSPSLALLVGAYVWAVMAVATTLARGGPQPAAWDVAVALAPLPLAWAIPILRMAAVRAGVVPARLRVGRSWGGAVCFEPWKLLAIPPGARPAPIELEYALRRAVEVGGPLAEFPHAVVERIDALRAAKAPPHELEGLAIAEDPLDRLAAEIVLARGGVATCEHLARAKDVRSGGHRVRIAAANAMRREAEFVARRSRPLVCTRCAVRARRVEADSSLQGAAPLELGALRYGACPRCGESSTLVSRPGRIVAVLDAEGDGRTVVEGDVWHVNWLARAKEKDFEGQELFEFDEVEIRSATDTEVRHFLVDVTEDTDRERKSRYASMRCTVSPACALEENTLRGLRAVFGEVRVGDR